MKDFATPAVCAISVLTAQAFSFEAPTRFPSRSASAARSKISWSGPKPSYNWLPLAAAQGEDSDGAATVSTYGETGSLPKLIVNGLTDFFNAFGRREEEIDLGEQRSATPQEVASSVKGDFDRNYLWTGDIDPTIFDAKCSFQDPTMSFVGLQKYQQNIENLRGIVDRFVRNSKSELLELTLDEEQNCVQTRWRMTGQLNFPWRPKIDVGGRTRFVFDPAKGNRVTVYDEQWEIPAAAALMQIVTPGKD